MTRVVPVPQTISPEAQTWLSRSRPDQGPPESLAERRTRTDASTAAARIAWSKICPVQIVEDRIAGIPVHIVTPDPMPDANRGMVLINLHGGGFNSDSGSYSESIPVAYYAKVKVVAILYRLAPEHPFPAGIDDAIAVYKELLKTYPPSRIAIYGTSAGAVMTAEVAVKLKLLRLPTPAALGIFSAIGDFARAGDSAALFTLQGLSGHLDPPTPEPHDPYYIGTTDPRDPILSPIYADLHGLPPRSLSQQRATPCSAGRPISNAPFSKLASMCVSSSSMRCLTRFGTTRNYLNPSKPATSWRTSFLRTSAGKRSAQLTDPTLRSCAESLRDTTPRSASACASLS